MVDGLTVRGRPSKESVLHDVLGLRERAEHAVRDADQKLTKRLEIVGHAHRPESIMPNRRDRRGRCDMAGGARFRLEERNWPVCKVNDPVRSAETGLPRQAAPFWR